MSGNCKKEDLRVIKTQKAFQNAIGTLLKKRKFKQLIINDLCEEALSSRAAFYTHYKDKYDLLEHWFTCRLDELEDKSITNVIGSIIYDNSKVMHNILYEAEQETIRIIVNSLIKRLMGMYDHLLEEEKASPEWTVLLHFCTGGLFEIVKLQSEQRHSQDFQSAQGYFSDLLKMIIEFHLNHKK